MLRARHFPASVLQVGKLDFDQVRKERAGRLKAARKNAGLKSATAAADALKISIATYTQHENGTRAYDAEAADSYATAFGVPAEWLLYGRRTVPLVGKVGAGSVAHFYASADEGLGEVDAPPGSTDTTRAAEIEGTSLGPAFDDWLVFYNDVRSPVTPDLHGKLCVVGLPTDQVLVKILRPAGAPNRYHLISNGGEETLFDQEVSWAARVKTMTPR